MGSKEERELGIGKRSTERENGFVEQNAVYD